MRDEELREMERRWWGGGGREWEMKRCVCVCERVREREREMDVYGENIMT